MSNRLGPYGLVFAVVLLSACGNNGGNGTRRGGSTGSGSTGTGTGAAASGGIDIGDVGGCDSDCLIDAPAPEGCGNGVLTEDEACDDANRVDGDGCSANCLVVAPGFSCHPVGLPCRKIARCGDAVVAESELCDDGNLNPGDGCSPTCKLEIGYKCDGEPSVCTPTTCGDAIQEGAEACDDGNDLPYDGCSSTCQAEPNCADGPCRSECGDGLLLGEECDDGNRKDGDGCSSTCVKEAGFECTDGSPPCDTLNGECVLNIPVIYRDFTSAHSDFAVTCDGLVEGIAQPILDGNGKPVLAAPAPDGICVASPSSFGEWYTDGAGRTTVPGILTLFSKETGGFVNRWGPNGEQWQGQASWQYLDWCGPAGTACAGPMATAANCINPPAGAQCFDPCVVMLDGVNQNDPASACMGILETGAYDGNPVFFPLDTLPGAGMDSEAKIPEQYGWPWPWEKDVPATAGAGLHNFFFTTEVVYWFQYNAAGTAALDFTGDDDVWVFVNGQLAVDLGGVHVPESGSVTIDGTSAATFGMTDGEVYQIRVFQAERKVEGSSFQLTLEGFNSARSDCVPVCGDGIVSLGEECDDGVNDGGYGECDVGCVLGGYCGDGIVQEGEDCDDGNRFDGDTCGSACRILKLR